MLSLLSDKKIDGVSIFSEYVSSNSIEELLELKEKKNIKIGLHFNLTLTQSKNKKINVKYLLFKSLFSIIDKVSVANDFENQLNLFIKKLGFYPDFIDGHEHVHAFPIISNVIYKKLKAINYEGLVRYVGSGSTDLFMRSLKYNFFLKYITLEIIAITQKTLLKKNNLKFNKSFDGLLPDKKSKNLKKILNEIYKPSNSRQLLIMCHPGSRHSSGSNFFQSSDRAFETNYLSKL